MIEKLIYNDLIIKLDSEEAYLTEVTKQNRREIKMWLVVKNGNKPVRDCRVLLEDLEYYFNNEWIFSPNGFDRKALKWGVGYDLPEGKVDISTNGSTNLEIAKSFRIPNPHLAISYLDGFSGKTHHLVGIYKLRLRIEGQVFSRRNLWDFEPIIYEVHLYL